MAVIPERPLFFHVHFNGIDPIPLKEELIGPPEKFERVCGAEWSWSPANERIDGYNLSSHGEYWILWVTTIIDECFVEVEPEEEDEDWNNDYDKKPSNDNLYWHIYAYGLNKNIDSLTAATYLLMDAWKTENKKYNLEHFHDFFSNGILSLEQVSAIADEVWGKS